MLIKTVIKFEDYFVKNFEFSERNVFGFPPKKWTISHSKFYASYQYSGHTQKIFISFEHNVSLDRS